MVFGYVRAAANSRRMVGRSPFSSLASPLSRYHCSTQGVVEQRTTTLQRCQLGHLDIYEISPAFTSTKQFCSPLSRYYCSTQEVDRCKWALSLTFNLHVWLTSGNVLAMSGLQQALDRLTIQPAARILNNVYISALLERSHLLCQPQSALHATILGSHHPSTHTTPALPAACVRHSSTAGHPLLTACGSCHTPGRTAQDRGRE